MQVHLVFRAALNQDDLLQKKSDIVGRVQAAASPITDVRTTKEYRMAMLKLFAGRLVDAFAGGTEVKR